MVFFLHVYICFRKFVDPKQLLFNMLLFIPEDNLYFCYLFSVEYLFSCTLLLLFCFFFLYLTPVSRCWKLFTTNFNHEKTTFLCYLQKPTKNQEKHNKFLLFMPSGGQYRVLHFNLVIIIFCGFVAVLLNMRQVWSESITYLATKYRMIDWFVSIAVGFPLNIFMAILGFIFLFNNFYMAYFWYQPKRCVNKIIAIHS